MSCAFDLAHYRELLEAAQAGGYRLRVLRPRARRTATCSCATTSTSRSTRRCAMAELEAEPARPATYFLMTESVFYNLASSEGERARSRGCASSATASACTPSGRTPSSTTASTRCRLAQPRPGVHAAPVDGARQRDGGAVLRAGALPLRLEPALAQRLPARGARRAASFAWLQLLTHPEIWAYPGATMGETMRAMLDAERERRLEQLADGPDRPLVKPLDDPRHRLAARPGTAALLRALRENGERPVRLVGTDMSERAIGRHLCDAFHLVPGGLRPGLRRRDARGLPPRGRRRRAAAVVVRPARARRARRSASRASPCSSRRRRRSAARTTRRRRTRCSTGSACAAPAWRRVTRRRGGRGGGARARLPGRRRLHEAGLLVRLARVPRAVGDGRPARAAADEPARASPRRCGSRSSSSCCPATGGPELLVMELATGGERTIDGIAVGGRIALGHPKTREAMRAGLAMYFETLDDAGADGHRRAGSSPSSSSTTSSTSSSSAST